MMVAIAMLPAGVVADTQTKNPNGALGLLVFLCLVVGVVFLMRSMTKHLRKAQRMKIEEQQAAAVKPAKER